MTTVLTVDTLIQERSPQAIRRSLLTLSDEQKSLMTQPISHLMGDDDFGKKIFHDIITSVENMDVFQDDVRGTVFRVWDEDDIFGQIDDHDREMAIDNLLLQADQMNPLTAGLSHERSKTVSRYDQTLAMLMTYVYDEDEYYKDLSYAVEEIRTALGEHDELFPTIDREDDAIFQIVSALADPTYASDGDAISSLVNDDEKVQDALRGAARVVLTQVSEPVDPDTWV